MDSALMFPEKIVVLASHRAPFQLFKLKIGLYSSYRKEEKTQREYDYHTFVINLLGGNYKLLMVEHLSLETSKRYRYIWYVTQLWSTNWFGKFKWLTLQRILFFICMGELYFTNIYSTNCFKHTLGKVLYFLYCLFCLHFVFIIFIWVVLNTHY